MLMILSISTINLTTSGPGVHLRDAYGQQVLGCSRRNLLTSNKSDAVHAAEVLAADKLERASQQRSQGSAGVYQTTRAWAGQNYDDAPHRTRQLP